MKKKRALAILNGLAGTGEADENALEIVTRLALGGYEPVIYPVVPDTELVTEKILPEYEGKVDLLLCCGGDGTLSRAVKVLMGMKTKPVVAYIPAGSTNDFARGMGIPADFDDALDAAVEGEVFPYDIGCFNNTYFNYVAAFGLFSSVSYDTDQTLKNALGYLAYIVSAIGELYQNINYNCNLRVELEDEVIEDNFVFGAVCNAVSIGGFKMFDNRVSLDDGKMELLLIKKPAGPVDLQGIVNALGRRTLDHPNIIIRQISKAKVISDQDMAWSLDGEYGGTMKEARFAVAPKAISIMRDGNIPT